tara:strand:+ start:415 stop:756 length:342 start_codon:yes stop_codon:yes gene_type:complete
LEDIKLASLSTKITLYLKANSVNTVDFLSDVKLQNDGSGDYIAEWNIKSVAKPSNTTLAKYETAGNTEEKNNGIRETRKNLYGDIGDQLDEIYTDIDAWKTRIKKIKDANPKE